MPAEEGTLTPIPTPRLLGIALLLVTAASVIVLPPGWPTIVLAVLAWGALARDDRLGGLLAGTAVILALPYDRAADVGVMRFAGFPVRPHDLVAGLALLTALPALRRIRWSPAVVLLAAFLAVGLIALAVGLLNGQALRDIFRDTRWWGLYAGGLFLAGQRRPPQDALRAVLIGLSVFAVLALAATVLPAFDGGIKGRAMAFDGGVLRMQFGPSAFLMIPIAYWTYRVVMKRRALLGVGALAGFVVAAGLTVTRVTLVVAPLVALGAALLALARSRWTATAAARAVVAGVIVVVALALAIGINTVGVRIGPPAAPTPSVAAEVPPPAPGSVPPGTPPPLTPTPIPTAPIPSVAPQDPLVRFFPGLDIFMATTGARFESYVDALALINTSPLVGHGLGTLVDISYGFETVIFDTPGKLPSVDDAYLTVGMKAGLLGILSYLALVLWPAWWLARVASRRVAAFLLPAWLGVLLLTLTQSFAVIGYSPFVLGILIVAFDRYPSRPAAGRLGQRAPNEGPASRAAEIAPS